MKKSFLLLCLASLMTISCQGTKNKDEMPDKLVGSWEWTRTEMPVSSEYPPETPETTGNQHLLSFTSDKTWTWLRNDTLCGEGTLEFDIWQDEDASEIYDCILFYNTSDGQTNKMFYFIFDANELHLYTHPLAGGSAHHFFSKKN